MSHENNSKRTTGTSSTRTSLKQPPVPSISAPLLCPPPVFAGTTNKDRRVDYEGGNNISNKNTMESPAGINSASAVATDSPPTTEAIMAQLVYQTNLMLQLQQQVQALHQKVDYLQHQQTKTTVSATAAAAVVEDAATTMPWGSSPMEMSTNSDERSFNFARTRIYLCRPSFSYDGTEEMSPHSGPPQATTTQQQQQQQQQQQRVLKTTRTVVMENDASKEAVDPNLETGPMEQQQQQQQPPPPPPLPQVRQTPMLLRILVMPFWLTYRYVQFEFQVLLALWRMGRREIRPLDGGVIMQFGFVLLIIAKTSRNTTKLQTLTVLVTLGFMYTFFVRRNIPLRIWKGLDPEGTDDLDAAAAAAVAGAVVNPRGQPQNGPPVGEPNNNAMEPGNNNNNNLDAAGAGAAARGQFWENTFFTGAIAPPNNNNIHQANGDGDGDGVGRNPITRLVWDIIYLFGSFFFSIFPMWRPEQRPRPVPQPQPPPQQQLPPQEEGNNAQEQQNANADNNHNNNNHNNNNNNHVNLRDNGGGGGAALLGPIPQVQPPRDAMEPTDDDDDDDEYDE
jgi:hypothetical protein